MKRNVKLLYVVFLLLAGCSPNMDSPVKKFDMAITESANTPIVNTKTITPVPTTTFVPQLPSDLCASPEEIKTMGPLVFYSPDKGLIFYNVAKDDELLIPNTVDANNPEISPDNQRIASFDFRSESGWIISANGDRLDVNTKDKFSGFFYGWLDNHKLIFVDRSHSDGSIITLDVDTGTISETVTGLQDINNLGPNRWYAGGDIPTAIFNSSLSRMSYLSGELPGENLGEWGFIMRETDTHKLLWSKVSSALGVQPKWSPNDLVAVVITRGDEEADQIHIIDLDGNEMQKIETNIIDINVVEWSPDGMRLAYGSEDTLIVFDFSSKQTHKFQLPNEVWNIIWSPSGDYIAAGGFLLDLSSDCKIPLKPNNLVGPYAWMAN